MAKRLYARYSHVDAGTEEDRKRCDSNLFQGELYPVRGIDMGQSYTSVWLWEFPDPFNSVNFDFFEIDGDEIKQHNIYKDPVYNPYIKRYG